ncbi:hypothetical protein RDI58_029070 [Solanum bulbocastanum]|uniref:Uncharacterized protein n=1 Tax=Solanum bulbocastanum TaxID=147425 RepID=A0AAN8XZK9_SOLBU
MIRSGKKTKTNEYNSKKHWKLVSYFYSRQCQGRCMVLKDPTFLSLDGHKEFSRVGKVHDTIGFYFKVLQHSQGLVDRNRCCGQELLPNIPRLQCKFEHTSFVEISVKDLKSYRATIYFELGGDSSLKQAFVSSLPKMLAWHTITIIEDRFKSITIPHIGYIRQAIFQAPNSIWTKRFVLKHIVQNIPALDTACSRIDLFTTSNSSCSSLRARGNSAKQYRRFKLRRPADNRSRMTRRTKFFRRRNLGN